MIRRLAHTRAYALADRNLDLFLATGFLVAFEVALALSNARRGPFALNAAVYGAMALSLAWRRRATLAVALAFFGLATFASIAITRPPDLIVTIPCLIFMAYSVGLIAEQRESYVGIVAGLVTITTISIVMRQPGQDRLGDVVFPTVFFCFLPWLAGRTMRSRLHLAREVAEKTARLEVEREERARRAVADDRARIARELHDVVAHSLTVMVIQAGAARRIVEQDPSRAAGVARVIKQMSREALDEMRRLVGVMTPDGEAAALAPQPTMQHVDSLVIRARAAGLKVDLTIDGERPELPPGIDVSAYRVVQEALMNTIKYAPSARARVQVRYGDAEVEVDVSDDGAGAEPAAGGADSLSGGQGLLGMRERVTLYGGDFESGPGDAGGFHVRARFPLVERVPA